LNFIPQACGREGDTPGNFIICPGFLYTGALPNFLVESDKRMARPIICIKMVKYKK